MAGFRTILRARLIEPCLDAALVVIEAPSGYGKSVLAEQLLTAWERPPLIVRLVGETGPNELVDRLRRSARKVGMGDLVTALTGDSAAAVLDRLVDYLIGRDLDIALLVDDAHFLDAAGAELLDRLTDDLPASCRSAISRRPTEARTHPRHALRLTIDDLRLTRDEVAAVLAAQTPSSVVDDVLSLTEGWPAAVAVAAGRIAEDPTWSPSQRSAGLKLLGGLIDDLVDAHGPTIADLARLPLIDAFAAETLAGRGALDTLRRSGLPHRVDGGWTVIPDSIRDGLRSLAAAGGRASRHDDQHDRDASAMRSIAAHYAARGELAAAVQLLGEANQVHDTVELLAQQHWTDLESLGLAQVEHALGRLPEPSPAAARLMLRALWAAEANAQAAAAMFFDRLSAERDLEPAITRAVDAERVRRLSKTMRPIESIELAERLLRQIPHDEPITRARTLLASAHSYAVIGSEAGHATARHQFEQAAQIFAVSGEHRWRAEALSRLGYSVLFHNGRPHEAVAAMETALSLLPSGDRTRATWLSSYADVLDTVGRDVEAVAATTEAIEIGERLNDHNVIAQGLWSRAWIAGRRGDLAGLRALLGDVERLNPGWLSSHSGIEFYGSLADFFVTLDDVDSARSCESKAHALHAELHYQEAIDMMTARLDAHLGDPASALTLLERLDQAIGSQPNTRWVRRLESALCCLRLGEVERARSLIDEAMQIVRSMGVADLPARFEAPLLARLAALDPGRGVQPPVDERFMVSVLGTFSVRQGHTDLTPPTGHPSTLVKLLVLRRTMSAEAVIDLLWPDADIDTGRARLRNTMNRLRARTGAIVERHQDTLVLSPSAISDLDAFEHATADALSADPAQRVAIARQAIALYPGDLLPGDVFEDWAAGPRERLVRRFLSLVDLVAAAAIDDGSLDEATRLLDIGLAADPLDERRYVQLGRLLRQQGRIAPARLVAERGVATFEEMGVSPSSELLELRR